MSKIAVVYWSGTGNTEPWQTSSPKAPRPRGPRLRSSPAPTSLPTRPPNMMPSPSAAPPWAPRSLSMTSFSLCGTRSRRPSATRRSSSLAPIRGPRASGWTTGRPTPTRPASTSWTPSFATMRPTMRRGGLPCPWRRAGLAAPPSPTEGAHATLSTSQQKTGLDSCPAPFSVMPAA